MNLLDIGKSLLGNFKQSANPIMQKIANADLNPRAAGVQSIAGLTKIPMQQWTPFTANKLPTTQGFKPIPSPVQQFRARSMNPLSMGVLKYSAPAPRTTAENIGAMAGSMVGAAPFFGNAFNMASQIPKVAQLPRLGRAAVDLGLGSVISAGMTPGTLKQKAQSFKQMSTDPTNIALSLAFPVAGVKPKGGMKALKNAQSTLGDIETKYDDLLNQKVGVQKEIAKFEAKPTLTAKGTFDKTRTNKLFNLKNDLTQIELEMNRLRNVSNKATIVGQPTVAQAPKGDIVPKAKPEVLQRQLDDALINTGLKSGWGEIAGVKPGTKFNDLTFNQREYLKKSAMSYYASGDPVIVKRVNDPLNKPQGVGEMGAKAKTTKPVLKIKPATKPKPVLKVRPGQVEQTFRTDKFNLNHKQTKTLDALRKTLGFETRGVRTFEDMKAMADELGTDPNRLLKDIQSGRITDKEVVALGNVISTSSQRIANLQKQIKANPTDKILLSKLDAEERVLETAIAKRIKGGTELGRGVAAFRIIANKTLDPAYWLTKAQKQLGDKKLSTEEVTAINKLIKDKDRIGLAKFVSLLGESSLREKAIGLWKAGLLTSFRTHEANILSNTIFGALETAKDVPATAFDIARSAITGKPRTKSFGVGSVSRQFGGAIEGGKQAKQSFVTGIDARDVQKLDTYKPLRFGNTRAGRIAQRYTDTIFGALGSEDKVFREMAIQRSLADQAGVYALNHKGTTVKQLQEMIANPPKEMIDQAIADARVATFTNDNVISDAIKRAKGAGTGVATALDVTMPFVRTPTNVLARVVDYTPVGIVRDTVRKIVNGASVSDRQLSESFGRSVTGLGIIWAGMQLAKAGKIQGASPATEAERSQMYLEGRQPNSILVNGKWRKIDRFSPMGNLLVLGSEYQKTGSLEGTAASGLKALTEQSFLQGASQAISAVQDPSKGAKKYIDRAVGGVIPNIIKDVARGGDEYKRETNGVVENIKYGLPGMRQTLPVMMDAMGNPVKQEGGMLTALFDPTNPTSATNDPIVMEMGRVGYNLNEVGDTLNKEKLTPAQKTAYQRLAGEQIQRFLPSVIQSQAYQQSDVDTQKSLIEKAVNKAKDLAREQIRLELPNIKQDSGIAIKAADTTGSTGKIYSYVDDEGSLKIVDLSSPIEYPKLSSNDAINKKLISSYKSKLTSRQTKIAELYSAGQITEAEAVNLWDEVEALKKTTSTAKKAKKVTIKKLATSKFKLKKAKRLKMAKLPKPKITKTKGYKILTYTDKTPTVKIAKPTIKWS